ncbi:MAG: acetylornithine deacetylase [Acidobacteriota bacterium]|jgi:acetylornithine deacetylase|nr:acetylornithine deacetylase [Acidobacteriota bacterium]
MDVIQFTRRLIDIPSVTGDEEEIGRFLSSHLEGLGYNVERQAAVFGRSNLIATTGQPPSIVFSTHMDTVPPFIPSSEDITHVYGRGACDAKGIIAAQIAAAEQLRSQGVDDIGLLFTVDEEASSLGARAANEHSVADECSFLINGEPTDNLLATGSKGSLRLRIRAEGRAAHSAYPEMGESAIERLLDALELLRKIEWPLDPFFGETTCNIGVISGGTRTNVIPAEAEAEIHIRLTKASSVVKRILETAIDGSGVQLKYMSVSEPVRMYTVAEFEQRIVRFTTDIPYLTKWGSPLLLGPGSILDAHTAHERVDKRELIQAVDLYVRLAQQCKREIPAYQQRAMAKSI